MARSSRARTEHPTRMEGGCWRTARLEASSVQLPRPSLEFVRTPSLRACFLILLEAVISSQHTVTSCLVEGGLMMNRLLSRAFSPSVKTPLVDADLLCHAGQKRRCVAPVSAALDAERPRDIVGHMSDARVNAIEGKLAAQNLAELPLGGHIVTLSLHGVRRPAPGVIATQVSPEPHSARQVKQGTICRADEMRSASTGETRATSSFRPLGSSSLRSGPQLALARPQPSVAEPVIQAPLELQAMPAPQQLPVRQEPPAFVSAVPTAPDEGVLVRRIAADIQDLQSRGQLLDST
eukprot:2193733-Amphidinium_carterae.1